jgi:hypothetical protein
VTGPAWQRYTDSDIGDVARVKLTNSPDRRITLSLHDPNDRVLIAWEITPRFLRDLTEEKVSVVGVMAGAPNSWAEYPPGVSSNA